MSFFEKLRKRREELDGGLLCIGLDPDGCANAQEAYDQCEGLISATKHVACCYKPNAAFFEQFGADGWSKLERLVADVVPVGRDRSRWGRQDNWHRFVYKIFDYDTPARGRHGQS